MTFTAKLVYWLPRVLSIAFALFLSLFALDVFSEYMGWSIVLPLLIHLIPALGLLAVSLIAWKFDLVGAFVFLGFAGFYLWDVGFGESWSVYASIVAPAALVGILFIMSWFQKRNRKQSVSAV